MRAAMHALKVMTRRAAWLIYAACLAPPAILVGTTGLMMYRDQVEPLDLWFDPISVTVPDFCQNTIPTVRYERTVSRKFLGSFTAWFAPESDEGFPVGRFKSDLFWYEPRPGHTVNPQLPDFMGQAFDLLPGQYHISVSWVVKRPGHFDAHPTLDSNVFNVIPRESLRCMSPGLSSAPATQE